MNSVINLPVYKKALLRNLLWYSLDSWNLESGLQPLYQGE